MLVSVEGGELILPADGLLDVAEGGWREWAGEIGRYEAGGKGGCG